MGPKLSVPQVTVKDGNAAEVTVFLPFSFVANSIDVAH